jgi:hypothetical protein
MKSTSDESCTIEYALCRTNLQIFTNSLNQSSRGPELCDGKFGSNALNIIKSVHVSPSSLNRLKLPKEKRVKRLSSSILTDKKQNCKSIDISLLATNRRNTKAQNFYLSLQRQAATDTCGLFE